MNQEDLVDDAYSRMDDRKIEEDLYLADLESTKKTIA